MVVLKGIVKEVAMLFVAIWLVLGSLAVPTQVADRTELAWVKLGLPVYFVVQDSSNLSIGMPDSPPFPYPISLGSPYNEQSYLIWNNFWLSVILVYAAVKLALYAINRNYQR